MKLIITGNGPIKASPSGYDECVQTWRTAAENFLNTHSAENFRAMERASMVLQILKRSDEAYTVEQAQKIVDSEMDRIYRMGDYDEPHYRFPGN